MTAERRGLSRPLKELIDPPSPEQLRTVIRILGLVEAVQHRLDREAAQQAAAGQVDETLGR
ncbi:hypothetical protein [Nonomuraea sp. GTA35]|uniref:hypothetical protein n=1 Tax=Nonomuraea sp. GTA35 TaxID=1676746 RepID=UPI0035C06A0A